MHSHDDRRGISRKQFLKSGALGALGLGLAGVAGAEARPEAMARVVLLRDREALSEAGQQDRALLGRMLGRALCAYTGESKPVAALRRFIRPTDTVGIKMNVMMTATHPELVGALVELLIEAGVKEQRIIIWDRDRAGIGLAGVHERSRSYGFDEQAISRIITEEATALINIPALKSHWLSGMAGALKNWAGAVTRINVQDQDTPYPFHRDSCADLGRLAALQPIRDRCRLTILDALRPLFEGGPQVNPAYLWHYGGLLVGEDQVAVDTICAELLLRRREQHRGRPWPLSPPVRHLRVAQDKYGLGVAERERIELVAVGESEGRLI